MSYIPKEWTNNELPALNATNLNHIEEGIKEAHQNIENIENNINEFDKKYKFSTAEQIIGTWIDGKPLYRKTLILSNIATTNYIDVQDVDNIYINPNHSYITWDEAQYSYPIDRAKFSIYKQTMIIEAQTEGLDGWTGKVTIEYTKTTDIV